MCLCTYLPTSRRNILFLSVFNVYQYISIYAKEREKRRIRNVETMISFNSGSSSFCFSLSQIVFSHHTRRKTKKVHKSPHRKKNNNNSKREQQQQQQRDRSQWGFFLVLQTKHLDHTIEMVNKEKICIKKNIFYHNNKHVTSKRLSVRVFFFFFL